jgi:hypothetical protein
MNDETTTHAPGVRADRDGFVTWQVGTCSCGWSTPWLSSRPRAFSAAQEHADIHNRAFTPHVAPSGDEWAWNVSGIAANGGWCDQLGGGIAATEEQAYADAAEWMGATA